MSCYIENILSLSLPPTSLPFPSLPQDQEMGSIDPQLERQVETIRNLVESYYGIVCKTVRDLVPKSIMFAMVNKLKDYMKGDLLPMIYAAGNQDDMMEESQEAARRRDEMIRMYHTCKDALMLISDVSSKTGEREAKLCVGRKKREGPDRFVECGRIY